MPGIVSWVLVRCVNHHQVCHQGQYVFWLSSVDSGRCDPALRPRWASLEGHSRHACDAMSDCARDVIGVCPNTTRLDEPQ